MEKQQAWILQPASGLCLLLLLQSSVLPLPWHEGHGNPPVKHFLMFYSAAAQALLEGGLWHCGSQRFLEQLLQGTAQEGEEPGLQLQELQELRCCWPPEQPPVPGQGRGVAVSSSLSSVYSPPAGHRPRECSAGAGGRSQTSTMLWMALLPDWALLFYFFSEVYGLGILQNLALGSNIK